MTNFSVEFFYKIFTGDALLPFLYPGAKKSKMTKNSNQGGSCLKRFTHIPLFCHRRSWARRTTSMNLTENLPEWTLSHCFFLNAAIAARREDIFYNREILKKKNMSLSVGV